MSAARSVLSEKQLAANRANARKSTGPRTPAGKARSSMNALAHGLTARRLVLPNEDRRDFEAFARAMRADLRPRGVVQVLLAGQVIGQAWKLRRAGDAQSEFVRLALERYRDDSIATTPGALLAAAVSGDPKAEGYLRLDDYAGRLQRSLFSALRRLWAEKKLALEARRQSSRLVSEANFRAAAAGAENGASAPGTCGYAEAGGVPPVASHN